MESNLCPVLFNDVSTEHSTAIGNWPCFKVISDKKFTVISPLVSCILSSVYSKLPAVINLFYIQSNKTGEHDNIIPSRPLTSINQGPE